MSEFKEVNISCEKWRCYHNPANGSEYIINNPKTLFLKKNSNSHRVLDQYGMYRRV